MRPASEWVGLSSLAASEHSPAYLAGVLVPMQDGEAQALPVGCAAMVGHAARPCFGGEGWIRTISLFQELIYSQPRLAICAASPNYKSPHGRVTGRGFGLPPILAV